LLTVAAGHAGPRVYVDLRDTTLRMALSFALDEAGWCRAAAREPGAAHVADRVVDHPASPPLDVLVIRPTPAACRRALDAFSAGTVRAVLRATDPSALPGVLELARRGLGVVPVAVVEAARAFPTLSPRLECTLGLVLKGWSNRAIARDIHQSEATTKRDVAELLRRFDAPNRMAMAAAALRLGVHPDGHR
jgi:DNA-binding CsgD family transcriptional regulator